MEKIYQERLLKFADFLNDQALPKFGTLKEVELISLSKKKRSHYLIKYHSSLLELLPSCFDDWYQNEDKILYQGCDPDIGIESAVIQYFSLTVSEFCHLFDTEGDLQNCEAFGGKNLNLHSSPSDNAQNIISLVRTRQQCERKINA